MYSNKIVIIAIIATFISCIEGGVLGPAVPQAVAPVVPAPIAYHHAVPYNVPPYSDRVDIYNKLLSVPAVAAVPAVPAFHTAPAVAAVPASAVPALATPHALPAAPAVPAYGPIVPQSPYAYAHSGILPAGYAAPFASPYGYGPVVPAQPLAAPFLRR